MEDIPITEVPLLTHDEITRLRILINSIPTQTDLPVSPPVPNQPAVPTDGQAESFRDSDVMRAWRDNAAKIAAAKEATNGQ